MTTIETKDRLIAELKKTHHGASTRHLCNLIFQEKHEKYTIRPGDHRMNQVYGYLKTLERQGAVVTDYPGHWQITQN